MKSSSTSLKSNGKTHQHITELVTLSLKEKTVSTILLDQCLAPSSEILSPPVDRKNTETHSETTCKKWEILGHPAKKGKSLSNPFPQGSKISVAEEVK